jgi:hypothetical protein
MTDSRPTRRITAPPITRATFGLGVIALAVFGVVVLVRQGNDWPFAAVLFTAAALIAFRGLGAGITLGEKELVVRDYLFTTRIRREQVTSVDRFPSIDWRDTNGVPRVTLFNVFLRHAAMITAPTDDDRAAARSAIQAWVDTPDL